MGNLSDDGGAGIEHNQIVKALLDKGETKPVIICGYSGPVPTGKDADGNLLTDPNKLRIYATLEDLTAWHDIETAAIIQRVTPKNPLLPSTFFLKADATASYHYPVDSEAQARFVGGALMEKHFSTFEVEGTASGTRPKIEPYKLTGLCRIHFPPFTSNPFQCGHIKPTVFC